MIPLLFKTFLTLFVVIDPIGLAPIFMTLAGDRPLPEQSRIARQAILVAGAILLVFALIGSMLLSYLEISLEAFQVAGGLLLFKIAVDMVFAHPERETSDEEKEAELREDISIFPLAIPLIAGPGTLASILILTQEADGLPFGLAAILAIAAIVLAITYVLLFVSGRLAGVLGQTGINVITRVLGVLLSALAVQYIANGAIVILKSAVTL